jgi:hypothetical protein
MTIAVDLPLTITAVDITIKVSEEKIHLSLEYSRVNPFVAILNLGLLSCSIVKSSSFIH